MATDGDATRGPAAQGNQKDADRVEQEATIELSSQEKARKLALIAIRADVYTQQVEEGLREFSSEELEQWMLSGNLDDAGLTGDEIRQVVFKDVVPEADQAPSSKIDVDAIWEEVQKIRDAQAEIEPKIKQELPYVKHEPEDPSAKVKSEPCDETSASIKQDMMRVRGVFLSGRSGIDTKSEDEMAGTKAEEGTVSNAQQVAKRPDDRRSKRRRELTSTSSQGKTEAKTEPEHDVGPVKSECDFGVQDVKHEPDAKSNTRKKRRLCSKQKVKEEVDDEESHCASGVKQEVKEEPPDGHASERRRNRIKARLKQHRDLKRRLKSSFSQVKIEVKNEPQGELKEEPTQKVKIEPTGKVKKEPTEEVKTEPQGEVKQEPTEEVKQEPFDHMYFDLKEVEDVRRGKFKRGYKGIAYALDGNLVKAVFAYKTKPDEKIPCGLRYATHMLEYIQGRIGAEWVHLVESSGYVYFSNGDVRKFVALPHLVSTCTHKEPDGSYSNRIRFWMAQCIEFQKKKYTWCPARPCCLPNIWLRPREPPSRDLLLPCFFKLHPAEKRRFRAFVESPEAEVLKPFDNATAMRRWLRLLHPERALLPEVNVDRGCGELRPHWTRVVTPELFKIWNGQVKNIPKRLWIGSRMVLTPKGLTKIPNPEVLRQVGAVATEWVTEPRAKRYDVDHCIDNADLVSGAQWWTAKGIAGLDPEGPYRGKGGNLRQGLQELPEMCKPDPKWEHVTHRHPKTYRPWERAAVEAKRRRLRGKQRVEVPEGQERVMGAGSAGGVQVAKPGGNTQNDPSRFLSLGELLESGKLESSSTAPVTIRVNARQSGVQGVIWQSKKRRWKVSFYERNVQKNTYFPVRKYFKLGMSEEEASNAALEAAIACRKSQEASGTAKVGQGAGGCPSGKPVATRGVCWDKKSSSWCVQICVKGKKISGGLFKPKDDSPEEVEKARLLALEGRRALERQYFRLEIQAAANPMRNYEMEGVRWDIHKGRWQVQMMVKGKNLHGGYFRPKDDSPEEMENARILALECRRALEKRYRCTESST